MSGQRWSKCLFQFSGCCWYFAVPFQCNNDKNFHTKRHFMHTLSILLFRVMFMFAGHIAISFRKEVKHILPSHATDGYSSRQWHTQQTNSIQCVQFWVCVYFETTTIFDSLTCHSIHFCAHTHHIVIVPLCLMYDLHTLSIQYDSILYTFWVVKRE